MFDIEAWEVLNNNKFAFANVCFQHEHNDDSGHYGQTLIRNKVASERKNKTKVITMLTWSGLRGTLAFALALSLESMPYGHLIIFLTYSVAGFSIIVQGLTIGKLVKWLRF